MGKGGLDRRGRGGRGSLGRDGLQGKRNVGRGERIIRKGWIAGEDECRKRKRRKDH